MLKFIPYDKTYVTMWMDGVPADSLKSAATGWDNNAWSTYHSYPAWGQSTGPQGYQPALPAGDGPGNTPEKVTWSCDHHGTVYFGQVPLQEVVLWFQDWYSGDWWGAANDHTISCTVEEDECRETF